MAGACKALGSDLPGRRPSGAVRPGWGCGCAANGIRRGVQRGVRRAQAIAAGVVAHYAQVRRDLPWRRTRDPYAIWVSEIMLQQTQVKTVLPYWQRWMRALPNLGALAKAKPERL